MNGHSSMMSIDLTTLKKGMLEERSRTVPSALKICGNASGLWMKIRSVAKLSLIEYDANRVENGLNFAVLHTVCLTGLGTASLHICSPARRQKRCTSPVAKRMDLAITLRNKVIGLKLPLQGEAR